MRGKGGGGWWYVLFHGFFLCGFMFCGDSYLLSQMLDTTIGSGAEHVYPKLDYKELGVIPNFGFSPKDGSLVDEVFFYKDLREA